MDWNELQQTWQQGPEPPMPDLEALIASRSRWIWLLTALDGVATVLIGIFIVWLLSDSPGMAEWLFAILVAAATALGWYAVLRIRHGTWRSDSRAPGDMLELLIRRCRASIVLAKMNLWALGVGVLVGVGFRFLLKPVVDVPELDMTDPTRLALRVGIVVVGLAWAVAAEWYRRRKTAELERLLAVREQLLDRG